MNSLNSLPQRFVTKNILNKKEEIIMNSTDFYNSAISMMEADMRRSGTGDIERVNLSVKKNSMQIDDLNNRVTDIESKIKDKHLTINLVHSNDNKSNENKIYMTDSQFNTLLNKLIINNR